MSSAGRPNAASNNDSDVKSENLDQLGAGGKPGSFNECRACNGLLAADCANAGFQTCNDAQQACQVEIRSQYKAGALEHRYYSRCTNLNACNAERARNFHSDKMYSQCRTSQMAPRFFQHSKCTVCTKLGSSANGQEHTVLFGTSTTQIYVETNRNAVIATLFQNPQDATNGFNDFYSENNWY